MFYVYELVDPRSDAVFYVGKGKGNRIAAHEAEAKAGRVSRKCDHIRAIWASGHKVVRRKVKLFQNEAEAYAFEEDLIDEYGLHTLTNVTKGGGGIRGGFSLAQDRSRLKAFCYLYRRLSGAIAAGIHGLRFGTSYMDFRDRLEDIPRGIADIVKRRGLEWANTIASRHYINLVAE